jgi:hypothetical protein
MYIYDHLHGHANVEFRLCSSFFFGYEKRGRSGRRKRNMVQEEFVTVNFFDRWMDV